jgi:hypothetical protein
MRLVLQKVRLSLLSPALKYALLPLTVAIYPAVFHYANNARLVLLSSAVELCIFLAGFGLVVYISFGLLSGRKFSQSAVGTLLVLAFFYTYGFVFEWLRSLDVFQVETYNFMFFWIFAALYLAWIVTRLNTNTSIRIWNISTLIFSVLMMSNIVKIIPVEIEKNQDITVTANGPASINGTAIDGQQYPDIYYLIFDEAAGFEVARRYWHYNEVDQFSNSLKENGFYVAEESHGGSTYTLREISTRLNYQEYPVGDKYFKTYDEAISHNRVMDYLKTLGYTLIAYDERRTPYPTMLPVPVDYLVEKSPEKNMGDLILLDDYKILVLQSTLLRSFLNQDPTIMLHKDMILYTVENAASTQISSPKFVYVHLMLPHEPFVFSENGNMTTRQTDYFNWQGYQQNYRFFVRTAQEMIKNILIASKGNAVIIIQSDHGARNFTTPPYSGFLVDYPDEYKTWIVNALYLPGCIDAPLTQDMDPINTFPIVFNCYFDANIPLQ